MPNPRPTRWAAWPVLAALALASLTLAGLTLAVPAGAAPGGLVVDSTADTADARADGACDDGTGHCTLRAAIEEANFVLGFDAISFDLPGTGPQAIALASSLPDIFDHGGTSLDCTTQPGWAGTPLVVIDASAVTAGHALRSSSGHLTLFGCAIVGAGTHGLILNGSHFNSVGGNWIGIDPRTGQARPNGLSGILVVDSTQNLIGGLDPGAGNLISGNGTDGILIAGGFASGNLLQGNWIGTDPSGLGAIGNGAYGINLNGAGSNTVGGGQPGAGNVIAASFLDGVIVQGADATQNLILGNRIGTDVTGQTALPNYRGIVLESAVDTIVGDAVAGNLISGNLDAGIRIERGALRATVIGNAIGLAADGSTLLGNGGDGVAIAGGSSACRVGGAAAGEGNRIAGNLASGVWVASGDGNRISRNSIDRNGVLGIDLGSDGGPTPNDPADADGGANHLQNYPLLALAAADCTGTTVEGAIDCEPGAGLTVEVFAVTVCDPSGHGEGAAWLGSADLLCDPAGAATFQVRSATRATAGQSVTATATGPDGSSSEFSACLPATDACPACGNGRPDPGEDCDDGGIDTPACNANCTAARCGDHYLNRAAAEECDDGNTSGGDGCSATCRIETCRVPSLPALPGLSALKAGASDLRLAWTGAGDASEYHVNSVDDRRQLNDPRRPPGSGVARCTALAPQAWCIDPGALDDPLPVRYYQVLAACGPDGADEGPP